MKRNALLSILFLLLISVVYASSTGQTDNPEPPAEDGIHWYTLEEALELQEKNPKKLFIDFYTDWCGWCKVMDSKTFTQDEVIDHLNASYYAVKFDAEQKEAVTFRGQTYEFHASGRRGINLFAYAILDKQASYPAFVVLDKELNRQGILRGYLKPDVLLSKLQKLETTK